MQKDLRIVSKNGAEGGSDLARKQVPVQRKVISGNMLIRRRILKGWGGEIRLAQALRFIPGRVSFCWE
jgi:hypothetical protein